ncbi:2163_t:CDS:2 [Funneliformis caledonium]|uniref:2163_t:CDS:1 n=1 Tax=Funneliformis caledonium TaxID=1117310 RepID=A0A9N8YZN2_9GLOM|nr:2163_t:CDS:2 [Funneliformis caledonium]
MKFGEFCKDDTSVIGGVGNNFNGDNVIGEVALESDDSSIEDDDNFFEGDNEIDDAFEVCIVWHHNPKERSNLQTVPFELDKLVSNYHQNRFSQSLIPKYINQLIAESVDVLEDKAKEWIEGAIKIELLNQ